MFTSNNHIDPENFSNLTNYRDECPEGLRQFYAYATFTDKSFTLYDRIFAKTRAEAYVKALARFADCFNHIYSVSIASDDGEE